MKKCFFTSLLVCLSVFSLSFANAQEFEGKITLKIEYEEVPEEYEPYINMFPKEMTTYVKGKKTCVEQNTMGGGTTTVMDSETGKGFMIMTMMGKKEAYEMSATDAGTKSETKPTITYTDETKEIAGYICKKAELKFEGEEEVMTVWYTEEIASGYNSHFPGIKGFLMEYSVENRGMVMVMTVTSVSKETVSDSKFTLPEGVELKPYSDFIKAGQGG